MSDAGYVRIYRRLLGHHAFRNDAEALAFAWMVIKASWQPVRVRYKGQSVALQRGQLAVSVRDLAEALDRPKGWVERLLGRLKSGTMIETRSETGINVITICNYDEYQADSESSETPTETARRTRAGQQQDTEQRREKGNKEEPNGSSPPISPEPKSKPVKTDAFVRPEWADPDIWSDLLRNRKAKRTPNTPTAYKRFLADITAMVDDEWPPGKLLEAIVARGWAAAYDPRGNRNGNRSTNDRRNPAGGYEPDRRDGFVRALDRDLGLYDG